MVARDDSRNVKTIIWRVHVLAKAESNKTLHGFWTSKGPKQYHNQRLCNICSLARKSEWGCHEIPHYASRTTIPRLMCERSSSYTIRATEQSFTVYAPPSASPAMAHCYPGSLEWQKAKPFNVICFRHHALAFFLKIRSVQYLPLARGKHAF